MPRDAKNMQHRQRIFSLKKCNSVASSPRTGKTNQHKLQKTLRRKKNWKNQPKQHMLSGLLAVSAPFTQFDESVFVKPFQDSHKNINYVCIYVCM